VAIRRHPKIVDADGVVGRLRDVRVHEGEHAFAVVELRDGARIELPFEMLKHDAGDAYVLHARWRDFAGGTEHSVSIPVIAERVVAKVRPAPERRLRVTRRVVEESRVIETPIERERIEIERVPVNVFVNRAPAPRQEGDTLIVPCIEEVVVIETRLRVREELRIRRVRERHIDRQTVVLRRHEVDIEDDAAQPVSINPKNQGENR